MTLKTVNSGNMTDPDLVHLLRSSRIHPTDACARLYDAHGAEVYRACRAALGDPDLARAALRDTLIAARAHIFRLHDPARLREWLLALAAAECARRSVRPAGGLPAPRRAADDGPPYRPGGAPEGADALKVRVLSAVAESDASGYRERVAARVHGFDRSGFPVARPPRAAGDPPVVRIIPGVAVVACMVLLLVLAWSAYLHATSDAAPPWPPGGDHSEDR
jgi:hypothetical protein